MTYAILALFVLISGSYFHLIQHDMGAATMHFVWASMLMQIYIAERKKP